MTAVREAMMSAFVVPEGAAAAAAIAKQAAEAFGDASTADELKAVIEVVKELKLSLAVLSWALTLSAWLCKLALASAAWNTATAPPKMAPSTKTPSVGT